MLQKIHNKIGHLKKIFEEKTMSFELPFLAAAWSGAGFRSGGEKFRYLGCAVLLSAILSKVYCN
jgi:hypothetical protein